MRAANSAAWGQLRGPRMRDTDGSNAVLPTPDEELRLNVLALEVHRRDDEVAVISSLKHFTVEVALQKATTGEDDRTHDGRHVIATLVYFAVRDHPPGFGVRDLLLFVV